MSNNKKLEKAAEQGGQVDAIVIRSANKGDLKMKTHELKTLPEYFNSQLNGMKNFEVRKNDRGFECFDIIILREWDGEKYTGRKLKKRITYIIGDDFEGIEKGFVVMGTSDFLGV